MIDPQLYFTHQTGESCTQCTHTAMYSKNWIITHVSVCFSRETSWFYRQHCIILSTVPSLCGKKESTGNITRWDSNPRPSPFQSRCLTTRPPRLPGSVVKNHIAEGVDSNWVMFAPVLFLSVIFTPHVSESVKSTLLCNTVQDQCLKMITAGFVVACCLPQLFFFSSTFAWLFFVIF